MYFISINGTPLPQPSTYRVDLSDLDSSNTVRSESGVLTRERIREGMRKISVSWVVNTENTNKIVTALSPAKFDVSYYAGQNSYKQATMYAGDKALDFALHKENEDWWRVSCNLIEY